MTVYVVYEDMPDKVFNWRNVIQIDKLENGHLILMFGPNEDGIIETNLHNVMKCEVME